MFKYQVFATARGEAEHSCDCELCTRPHLVEVTAAYDTIIEAESDEDAEAQASAGITAALEDATPPGYWLVDYTVMVTQEVNALDDIALARLSGYPALPGFGV